VRRGEKEDSMAEREHERTHGEDPSELADELAEQDLEQAAGGTYGYPYYTYSTWGER
jgi:hypothetical protein